MIAEKRPTNGRSCSDDRTRKRDGSLFWHRRVGGVTENKWCEREEEEEEEEGDAGHKALRESVYRFINSRAVSKSSRSSESLWIEAQKGI